MLRVACCMCCMLHVACCMLPVGCSMLHVAYPCNLGSFGSPRCSRLYRCNRTISCRPIQTSSHRHHAHTCRCGSQCERSYGWNESVGMVRRYVHVQMGMHTCMRVCTCAGVDGMCMIGKCMCMYATYAWVCVCDLSSIDIRAPIISCHARPCFVIHRCSQHGPSSIVSFLIAAGADVNIKSTHTYDTT